MMSGTLRRGWETFDPRDGRPVSRHWTESGAATSAGFRGLDYGRRGAGWVDPHALRVTLERDRGRRVARLRKLAGAAGVLAAFAGGWLAGAGSVSTAGADNGARVLEVPAAPCASDDGPGPCYWDAGMRGNGRGRSFVVDRAGRVSYLAPVTDGGAR